MTAEQKELLHYRCNLSYYPGYYIDLAMKSCMLLQIKTEKLCITAHNFNSYWTCLHVKVWQPSKGIIHKYAL
uniref:Uncharacterized protein n=1 Tax=Solanum tuberosum TaxID=4113 RepID=M0ZTA5_SOLTU